MHTAAAVPHWAVRLRLAGTAAHAGLHANPLDIEASCNTAMSQSKISLRVAAAEMAKRRSRSGTLEGEVH